MIYRFALIICLGVTTSYAKSEDPFTYKIGIILPLTGDAAVYGNAIKNGITLAQKEFPKEFSRIALSWKDDQFEPRKAISAYHALVEGERVDSLFVFGLSSGQALAPLNEKRQIPLILFSFSMPEIFDRYHYVIQTLNSGEQYMLPLLSCLRSMGEHHFKVIQTQNTFTEMMVEAIRSHLIEGETLEVIAQVEIGEMNFDSILPRLKDKHINRLGVFLFPAQIAALMRGMVEKGVNLEVYGTDLFEPAATLISPKVLEGALYPDNQASLDFKKRYETQFENSRYLTFAGAAYEMAHSIASIISNYAYKLKGEDLIAEIKKISKSTSVLGDLRMGNGGHFEYPVVIKQIDSKGKGGISDCP